MVDIDRDRLISVDLAKAMIVTAGREGMISGLEMAREYLLIGGDMKTAIAMIEAAILTVQHKDRKP